MNFQQVRQVLKNYDLGVFTTQDFVNVFKLDPAVVAVKLSRYKKAGYLLSPKRGVYYLTDEVPDKFRIANRIYFPSYVSLDSILSRSGIIPETVYAVTSITARATREYSDNQTVYKYYKIKKEAYNGYIKDGEALVATKEKALVDYLYFVSQGKRALNERLNLSGLDYQEILYYTDFFKDKRLDNLTRKIFK